MGTCFTSASVDVVVIMMIRRILLGLQVLSQLKMGNARQLASSSPEFKLVQNLFKDQAYNANVRPRFDPKQTVDISVSFFLTSIGSTSEKDETITINGWLHLEWRDDFLCWNATDYGGISMIVVDSNNVWRPDLIFQNSVADRFYNVDVFRARVYSNCSIIWEPGGPMPLFCRYLLTDYPFDQQNCAIKVAAWANTGSKANAYSGGFNMGSYEMNGEWNVVGDDMVNYTYKWNGEDYTEVHFFLKIKRKPLFAVLNILLPIILLSALILTVFYLPPESGEKASLAITILLAFSVWLLMMNQIMPSSSEHVPVMEIYITIFMIISAVTVLVSVAVIRLHERTDWPIPKWAERTLGFHKWLCINRCSKRKQLPRIIEQQQTSSTNDHRKTPEEDPEQTPSPTLDNPETRQEHKFKISAQKRHAQHVWREISRTVDAFAFYAFCIFIVLLTIIVIAIMVSGYQLNNNDSSSE